MTNPWHRFRQAARLEEPDQVPVAFIVDSPWLPGYAGINISRLCPFREAYGVGLWVLHALLRI